MSLTLHVLLVPPPEYSQSHETAAMSATRLVMVTGANRGFGRAVAVEVARKWTGNVDLLLTQRSTSQGMDETLKEVQQASGGATAAQLGVIDMSAPADAIAEATRQGVATALEGRTYAEVVLVHNAGSIGPIDSKTAELQPADIEKNIHENVTAFSVVNSTFLSIAAQQSWKKTTVVNISSLCGVKAFEGFNVYCLGKAARDMAMQVTAVDHPDVRCLNWAPGPMLTDMNREIRERHVSGDMRKNFQSMVDEGTIVDPNASAKKLSILLDVDTYENAAHIDYFDV